MPKGTELALQAGLTSNQEASAPCSPHRINLHNTAGSAPICHRFHKKTESLVRLEVVFGFAAISVFYFVSAEACAVTQQREARPTRNTRFFVSSANSATLKSLTFFVFLFFSFCSGMSWTQSTTDSSSLDGEWPFLQPIRCHHCSVVAAEGGSR